MDLLNFFYVYYYISVDYEISTSLNSMEYISLL